MQTATPSYTALRVAMRRATHQLIDHPRVFDDPLALRILPEESRQRILTGITAAGHPVPAGYRLADPPVPLRNPAPTRVQDAINIALRAFMTLRNRIAEDVLADAIAHAGCTQYVVLGAGLDTFAYRRSFPHLHVFEVDHPVTQQWKLGLLAENNIAIPPTVTHAPIDFEHLSLTEGLAAAQFDFDAPTVFAWLGVVPYLTLETFRATAHFIGQRPLGSAVVFDYSQPKETIPAAERVFLQRVATRVAKGGEPFQLYFTPTQVAAELTAAGLPTIEDLDSHTLNARYFTGRTDGFRCHGEAAHILIARRA